MCFVFFFKQKTAYEMRISDWSSDVCSSDLLLGGNVAAKIGGDGARVHRRRTDSARLVAPVEFDCEEDIGGLRAAIGDPGIIGLGLEIGIGKIDAGKTVPARCDDDEPSAVAAQRRDAVHQNRKSTRLNSSP